MKTENITNRIREQYGFIPYMTEAEWIRRNGIGAATLNMLRGMGAVAPPHASWDDGLSFRLFRFLAQLGIGSREQVEELFSSGWLNPGNTVGYGRSMHNELCKWLGVGGAIKENRRRKFNPYT